MRLKFFWLSAASFLELDRELFGSLTEEQLESFLTAKNVDFNTDSVLRSKFSHTILNYVSPNSLSMPEMQSQVPCSSL